MVWEARQEVAANVRKSTICSAILGKDFCRLKVEHAFDGKPSPV
jgi:hypothetical protein